MTFNQINDHFLDVNWIRCPERLHVNYKRTGIKWECHYPNNYWAERTRIFHERFGDQNWTFNKTFDMFTKEQVHEIVDTPTIYVCFNISSLTWGFKADIRGVDWRDADDFNNWIQLWPRSNREITEESIMDTVWKFVDKLLFKAGRFREIQKTSGYSKQKVKDQYRKYIHRKDSPECADKDIRKAIRRKYEIEFSDCLDPAEHLAEALKHRKAKGTLWVMPEPDMSWVLNECDGDVDELERVFNEEYPQYKPNTLLVEA